MIDFDSLFNYSWFMESLDCKTGQMVEKEVFVTDLLDGPGEAGDYVTVEGLQDWEIDMPFEDFLKNAKGNLQKQSPKHLINMPRK